MRNSLKAVVFGAISIMFSAGLQAEVHQHEGMSAASEGTTEQLITGTGIVKDIDLTNKKVTISHEA
ncbi:cation efflux system protein CusF, partial [Raoultella ornithinolytica]